MDLQIEHGIPIPPPLYHQRGRSRREGVCSKCSRVPRPGLKTCDKHLAEVHAKYVERRQSGLCAYGGSCNLPVEPGHALCQKHREYVGGRIKRLLDGRVASGLCRQCGKMPRILGDAAYCVLCRQKNRKGDSPLPQKIRRIIRQFWRLDRIDKRRAKVEGILPHLNSERLQQILKLRHGLTDGIDHTLEEVGNDLGVTRERIRQLEAKAFKRLEVLGLNTQEIRPPFADTQRAPKRARNLPESERKKFRAHKLVKLAIDSGDLCREPCEKCGRADAIAHHRDYDKPLDVEWLCRPHHMEAHGRGKGERQPKVFGPSRLGKVYGPQPHAWWLNRAQPNDLHYAASEIVATLRAHNLKQKEVSQATGLRSPVINLIVNGKEVKDKYLIAMLRYVETLKTAAA